MPCEEDCRLCGDPIHDAGHGLGICVDEDEEGTYMGHEPPLESYGPR